MSVRTDDGDVLLTIEPDPLGGTPACLAPSEAVLLARALLDAAKRADTAP